MHYPSKEKIGEKRKQLLNRVGDYFKKMGITYEYEMLYGEAPKKTVEFANSHDFDLVVVGSRGSNGLQEMVLGSVSHKVAKRVKAPVMIIK